jgi:GTP-binding protein
MVISRLPDPASGDYAHSMNHTNPALFRFAPLRRAAFRLSVTQAGQLPPDDGAEVAIAGRSNVGKSSTINMLTERRALARVSRTPGRTQAINVFDLDPGQRLVDLPGYGYAKVPEALRRSWGPLLEQYLRRRSSLRALILVMDIRHPYGPHDADLIDFAAGCGRPVHILLNKADKLSRGAAIQEMARLRRLPALQNVAMQLFSAQTGQGLDELHERIASWLALPTEKETPTKVEVNNEPSKGGEDS